MRMSTAIIRRGPRSSRKSPPTRGKPSETGLRAIADAPDPAFDKLERIISLSTARIATSSKPTRICLRCSWKRPKSCCRRPQAPQLCRARNSKNARGRGGWWCSSNSRTRKRLGACLRRSAQIHSPLRPSLSMCHPRRSGRPCRHTRARGIGCGSDVNFMTYYKFCSCNLFSVRIP